MVLIDTILKVMFGFTMCLAMVVLLKTLIRN